MSTFKLVTNQGIESNAFPCSIAIERERLCIPFWYIRFFYSKVLFIIWRPNFLCGFLLVIFVTKAFSGSVKWLDRGVMLICQVWQVSDLWELWCHQKNKRLFLLAPWIKWMLTYMVFSWMIRTTKSREISFAWFGFEELYFIGPFLGKNKKGKSSRALLNWAVLHFFFNLHWCFKLVLKSMEIVFFSPTKGSERVLSHPTQPSKFKLLLSSRVPSFFLGSVAAASPLASLEAHALRCVSRAWLRSPDSPPAGSRAARPGDAAGRPSTGAWKQLTADSGDASHPRISLQLAAASRSHNPLLGLLQSFQQTLSEKKMSWELKVDWSECRKGSPTC